MQWRFISGFLVLMAAFFLFTGLSLAVPGLISYQGKLTDTSGTPLDGNYEMRFALYTAETGGTMLWNHIPDSHFVTVSEGVFNVQLGSLRTLTAPIFEWDPVYLEIYIYNSDTESWETFDPRQQLTSAAYALRSEKASEAQNANNAAYADTLDGFDSTDFATAVHGHSFSEISGSTTDAQIPDNITINYATDADTVDGHHAAEFAGAGHTHDNRYYTETEVNSLITGLQDQINSLQTTVNQLTTLLADVTRDGDDIFIDNANLHIRDGSGTTDGTVNGLGNLIIGYNEERDLPEEDIRTGSHNIIVGRHNNFSAFGGLVVGTHNEISGKFSCVSGGSDNKASGDYASISGGANNNASNLFSSVSGGSDNEATGRYASISGGSYNTANGNGASVSGGERNSASSIGASISGGMYNKASGEHSYVGGGGGYIEEQGNLAWSRYSAVLGGRSNVAGDTLDLTHFSGPQATVSGGLGNKAQGEFSSISGGINNRSSASYASVSGGGNNTADGFVSSVSGGSDNTASGSHSNVSGGENNAAMGYASFIGGGGGNLTEDGNLAWSDYSAVLGGASNEAGDTLDTTHASGFLATVSGGFGNKAQGGSSSVSGGKNNEARRNYASVSGGEENIASGLQSSVSGGKYNLASGDYASVSGGRENVASGAYAGVSGGQLNEASGIDASVSGGYNGTAAVDYHDWQAGTYIYDHSEQP